MATSDDESKTEMEQPSTKNHEDSSKLVESKDESKSQYILPVEGPPVPRPEHIKYSCDPLEENPPISAFGVLVSLPLLLVYCLLGVLVFPGFVVISIIGILFLIARAIYRAGFQANVGRAMPQREVGVVPAEDKGCGNPLTSYARFVADAKQSIVDKFILRNISYLLRLLENRNGSDLHIKLLWIPVKSGIDNFVPTATSEIPLPETRPDPSMPVLDVRDGLFYVADEDEDVEGRGKVGFTVLDVIHNVAPFYDSRKSWGDSDADADNGAKQVAKDILHGNYMPLTNVYWGTAKDCRREGNLTLHGFQGLLSLWIEQRQDGKELHSLAKKGDHFVVDMDKDLYKYNVRGDHHRYGGIVFYNKERKVNRILFRKGDTTDFNEYTPDHKEWSAAEFGIRSTAIFRLTMWDHLVHAHFMFANSVMLATRRVLHCTHPVRRFVKVFTFRTAVINKQAQATLFPERGVLHRATALKADDFRQCLRDGKEILKFRPFPDELRRRGFGDLVDRVSFEAKQDTPPYKVPQTTQKDPRFYPYGQDGMEFWNVCYAFVKGYFDKCYQVPESYASDDEAVQAWWDDLHTHVEKHLLEKDEKVLHPGARGHSQVVEFLTGLVFTVSGFHEHVGNVGEYVINPAMCSPRFRWGDKVCTKQSSYQLALVTALTGLRMPSLMGDFSQHFIGYGEIYQNFKRQLDELSFKIDQRNVKRESHPSEHDNLQPHEIGQAFYSFCPRLLETSVSI